MNQHIRKTKTRLLIVMALLIVGYIIFDRWREKEGGEEHKEGVLRTMPVWKLETLDGDEFHSKYLEGDVVLLHFWETWCLSCRSEISLLNELERMYGDDGLKVIAIAMDDLENSEIKAFSEGQGIHYLILKGDAKIIEDFGDFDGVPATFIIDRDGNIRLSFLGKMDFDSVKKVIESLL